METCIIALCSKGEICAGMIRLFQWLLPTLRQANGEKTGNEQGASSECPPSSSSPTI